MGVKRTWGPVPPWASMPVYGLVRPLEPEPGPDQSPRADRTTSSQADASSQRNHSSACSGHNEVGIRGAKDSHALMMTRTPNPANTCLYAVCRGFSFLCLLGQSIHQRLGLQASQHSPLPLVLAVKVLLHSSILGAPAAPTHAC